MADKMTCHVDGTDWHLYAFEYQTCEGRFSANFYATSDAHAVEVMREIRETSILLGRVAARIEDG